MFKTRNSGLIFILFNLFFGQFNALAQPLDTTNLSGIYVGDYRITMRAAPTGAILGNGVHTAKWQWDFDTNTATVEGTTLSVGFNYALHDIGNASATDETLYFDNNGDGTYRLYYSLQIYHPGLGNPMASASTTFKITAIGNQLQINTIDAEDGPLDGIVGTQIAGVFPLTIEPDLRGTAVQKGADSDGDGLSDQQAIELGLEPNDNDSDKDGIDNITEIGNDVSNPIDSDNDGIIDALEYGEAANDAQIGMGLKLVSGDFVELKTASNWALKAIMSGDMQHRVDNLDSIEDIANTDSTLGDPGLTYHYGNISFNTYQTNSASTDDSSTVTFNFSTALPEKLLLYSIEATGESELYRLMPTSAWQRLGTNSIAITVVDGSASDIDQQVNGTISLSIAITGNNLGDIQRNDHVSAGSLHWLLILSMMLLIILRFYNKSATIKGLIQALLFYKLTVIARLC
ncbi:choice-of-anchor U domain-containing protein [Psychromonas hadalis]|uniref:choice-of-anchor U domain-containing protein n=1 Tax=Psychromonas hadalis TaxID=211669 RepID=UPI0003B6D2AA|nr:choice-of-anchor U domain-containing protein [Psychromonas hadalis]